MAEPLILALEPGWLVAAKPAGMHTAPLEAGEGGTLLAWLGERHPEVLAVRGRKSVEGGLLHRLDRETSGLVLAARDQAAFDALMELSESGGILKRYSAVCRPSFSPAPGRRELLAPLGWTIHAWAEILHALDSGPTWPTMTIRSAFRAYGPGRRLVAAVTESAAGPVYETRLSAIEPVPAAESAFAARVELRRGFRHQVRCHLASVGLPLIGDPLYGPPGAAGRLLLHAESLEFSDPLTGEARSFRLPADWGADRHGG